MRTVRWMLSVLFVVGASAAPCQSSVMSRQQYDAYLNELRTTVLRGDAEALGALVTEDRVSVSGASGKTTRGRAAQIAADREVFRSSQVTAFEMRVTDFRGCDSLAYATGVGVHTVVERSTGKQRVDRFQYVEILVLEKDGKWRSRYLMNAPVEPGN